MRFSHPQQASHGRAPWLVSLPLIFLAGLAGGCDKSNASYVPSPSSAQDALKLALDAWKESRPAEPVGKLASGATVRAIDMDWAAGKKLTAYEIVKELPATGEAAPRQFSVKLTLAGAAQPVEATYYVVGIDPLQVYRDKDYDRYFGASGR